MTASSFALYSPQCKRKISTVEEGKLTAVMTVLLNEWEIAALPGYDALTRNFPRAWSPDMHSLTHWFGVNENILAVLITVGVALLLVCCLQCSKCGCREKDELFKRREV
jgi:hypothetical protein